MNNDFKTATAANLNNQLSTAQDYYLKALRALIKGEESKTGVLLNRARDSTLGHSTHWSGIEEAHFEAIHPSLTRRKFEGLYGDHGGSGDTSPWVRHPQLLAMIEKHLGDLGTLADVRDFRAWKETHKDILDAYARDNAGKLADLDAPKPPFPASLHIA